MQAPGIPHALYVSCRIAMAIISGTAVSHTVARLQVTVATNPACLYFTPVLLLQSGRCPEGKRFLVPAIAPPPGGSWRPDLSLLSSKVSSLRKLVVISVPAICSQVPLPLTRH